MYIFIFILFIFIIIEVHHVPCTLGPIVYISCTHGLLYCALYHRTAVDFGSALDSVWPFFAGTYVYTVSVC